MDAWIDSNGDRPSKRLIRNLRQVAIPFRLQLKLTHFALIRNLQLKSSAFAAALSLSCVPLRVCLRCVTIKLAQPICRRTSCIGLVADSLDTASLIGADYVIR